MNKYYNNIKANKKNNKTMKEWEEYKKVNNITNDVNKDNFLEFGNLTGKKYAIQTNYGEWDVNFTIEMLLPFLKEFYKKLKDGGTLIIFYDFNKLNELQENALKYKFKQPRRIQWIKSNPPPLNSPTNYLTNGSEFGLTFIKSEKTKSKHTFNSVQDNGIYRYAIPNRTSKKYPHHPHRKPIELFEDLIKKHSNENDIVLDTFLGSGTTAFVCKETKRYFKGCEISEYYYNECIKYLNEKLK